MTSDLWAAVAIGLGMAGISPVVERQLMPTVLGYVELRRGKGEPAAVGDRVTFDFVVQTPEGRELANSNKRGLPFTVLYGEAKTDALWNHALAGIREGSERTMDVDGAVFFGPEGVPPVLAAGSPLKVTVRVLRVQRAVRATVAKATGPSPPPASELKLEPAQPAATKVVAPVPIRIKPKKPPGVPPP